MRKVIVGRFMGKPLEVSITRDDKKITYTGLQAERALAVVNCILLANLKAKSKGKRPGILDKMTFVVIPNF
ncbi:hypothetical protein LCGC14_1153020 [marine sediment metagenome]|uniref:Uncharacterized protein n=1 Tax=marine sediment metagenome TaxID=412755 RepID=A0A0F9Q0F4_9ZZZZ